MELTYLYTPEKDQKGGHQKKLTKFKGWHWEVPWKVPQKREHCESTSAMMNRVGTPKCQKNDAIAKTM